MTEPNERVYPSTTQGSTPFSSLTHLGLTKREYFAAMAMQGICANTNYSLGEIEQGACCNIVDASLAVADQMIAELNKEL